MSDLKVDGVIASTGTNTNLTLQGKGSGKVAIGDGALLFPDADGSANQVIETNASGVLSFVTPSAGGFTLATPQATTSGTSKTFGSIPSGTKRIIISLASISLGDNNTLVVEIGDGGGIETSGYINDVWEFSDSGNAVWQWAWTAGFGVVQAQHGNAEVFNGQISLALEDSSGFTWTCIGQILGNLDYAYWSSGTKSLSAELTQLRLTTSGAFDAGAINISYQ